MEYFQFLLANLLSSGLLLAGSVYLFQSSLVRILDKRMELFKQQLQVDTKLRELTLKSQIEFRERQLGDFYGPIYALLQRGKPIYRLWLEGRLDEIDDEIRTLFVDANDSIVKIILQKSHLIDGATIPETFTHFLTHVAIWHGYTKTQHGGVPLTEEEFPEAYYARGFEEDIFRTTERLKRELFELHNSYGLLSRPGTSGAPANRAAAPAEA